jgi:CBS domain-containing protein
MQAKDIMTVDVITVDPDTAVDVIARLLLDNHIRAVPVVASDQRVVGIVSESDLLRRPESGTDQRRGPRWLHFLVSNRSAAADYLKTHGTRAEDVMSRNPLTVTEDTEVGEIAHRMEKHKVKRLPVLRDGRLVGIVSRANLLQGLAAHRTRITPEVTVDDNTLRNDIIEALRKLSWGRAANLNVTVTDGVAELWGWVDSEQERKALLLAAREVPGVRDVQDHLSHFRVDLWT